MGAIMNDLDIIKKIEKQIEISLQEMPLDELKKNLNKPIRGYAVDDTERIIGLCINSNYLSDISFLKELKGLSTLDLSYNNISDISFLKELKGLSTLYLS